MKNIEDIKNEAKKLLWKNNQVADTINLLHMDFDLSKIMKFEPNDCEI